MSAKVSTYLDPAALPFPFCPGCGHGTILERLDEALVRLDTDPTRLVLVSDIGCSGLSDAYFATNAFHGLHGRSVTYATGLKLANPELRVVVLMGDGGCGIGGHHLINAARRNIGVTVIVFNNLNYGMTGGEHSVSTPPSAVTATTPLGQLERPMDIGATVAVNGASFVARTTTFDPGLTDVLCRALQNDGFSLVDVWELCTAYFAPANRLGRKAMEQTLDSLGFGTGILVDDPRPEYANAYRTQHAPLLGEPALPSREMEVRYEATLTRPLSWLLAGGAGKRIGSAAGALTRGAVLSGLWATQRSDYPVTVRTGHSLSEVILSPDPVLFSGVAAPDIVLDISPEGHAKVAQRLAGLPSGARVYRSTDVPEAETDAEVVTLDFAAAGWSRRREWWALIAAARALRDSGAYPGEALRDAVAAGGGSSDALAAVDVGFALDGP
jgi:2-oxoglutarate ferredoxin oxidoreductase subunit beta